MENIFSCINNVAIFVLLVIPGFFAKRTNLINSQHIDGLSSLLLNFLWPAMVLDIMNTVEVSGRMIHIALYAGGISAVIYVISCGVVFLYLKLRRIEDAIFGVLAFSMVFNNTGFIGIPFVQAALGKEAGFAASIIEVINDLLIYTLGILLIQYGKTEHNNKDNHRKVDIRSLCSPGFISVILGLLIFGFDIPLPDCLGKALGYMGNATTALAMFLVGAQLGEMKWKQLFGEKSVLEVIVWRLVLIPAAVLVMLMVFFHGNSICNQVLVLLFCMPCATCQAVFARQYRLDYRLATTCVMATTLLLMVTLPVWSMITTLVL